MYKKALGITFASGIALALFALAPGVQANDNDSDADTIDCRMDFTLSGWSAIYKTANGSGTVTCDNGQSMDVALDVKGGGLTAGAYKINDGHGKFSNVSNIEQVLGTYANATAHAGAVKSSHATAMTKGDVSLELTGTGNGWNLGAGISGFTIERASTAADNGQRNDANNDNDASY